MFDDRKTPVMADVAAHAGVSHQTVSRVLNSPELVRPNTQQRVHRAIEALGYRRNMSARALATNRSHLIGLVTPGLTLFGPTQTTMAVQDAARASGYATTTAGTEAAKASPQEVLEFFLDVGVAGIIVIAPTLGTADAAKELAGKLPVVVMATDLPEARPLHVVAIDHQQGAREATRHLIELGHQHIAHVAGPADWFDARARVEGWRAELRSHDLDVPEPVDGGWQAGQGYSAGQHILAQETRPSAVFAANDLLALGLIRAFREAGLKVPDDIAIVGYDNSPGSDYYEPPLTTVRQPFDDVSHKAITCLLKAFDDSPVETMVSMPELIIRASSDQPPH